MRTPTTTVAIRRLEKLGLVKRSKDQSDLRAVLVDITDKGFVEYLCEPATLDHLTGSLRHSYLCGDYSTEDQCDLQFWVIDPRFDDDVEINPPKAGGG